MASNRNEVRIRARVGNADEAASGQIDTAISMRGRAYGITYRRVRVEEMVRYLDHLRRLDRTDRKLRFLADVPDQFLAAYISRLPERDVIVVGAFADGILRGVVEIAGCRTEGEAEIVTTVEPAFQALGIENDLVERAIRVAEWQGAESVTMLTLCCNSRPER